MLITENIKLNNTIKCTLRNKFGEIVQICEQPNTVVNFGKQLILDGLGESSGNYKIRHGAVGISSGTTSAASAFLQTELGRNIVTYNRAAQMGTYSVFFNTSEVSGNIAEVGFFGGTSSFTSTNTGIMFNRIVLTSNLIKNQNYTLTLDLDVGF